MSASTDRAQTTVDSQRRDMARRRADVARAEARYHEQQANVARSKAVQLEKTWQIPHPCDLCGERECSH